MFLGNWVYHISSKGSDENMCGGTDTACRTLEHVLSLYNRYEPAPGLVIDHHLMVRYTVCLGQTHSFDTCFGLNSIIVPFDLQHSLNLKFRTDLSFQNAYPMLAKYNLRFCLNKNVSEHVTLFVDEFNFLNSYWHFSHVNLNMINCETAFLTLKSKYSTNVIIDNCTFGDWTFKKVQKVINNTADMGSTDSIDKSLVPTMNFKNSTGSIEKTDYKNSYFFSIQNCTFHNNQVTLSNPIQTSSQNGSCGAFDLESHGKIEMKHMTFFHNKATLAGGVISLSTSVLEINQSQFSNNYADGQGRSVVSSKCSILINDFVFDNNIAGFWGGAIAGVNYSTTKHEDSRFINNSVPYETTCKGDNYSEFGGGAIAITGWPSLNSYQSEFYSNKSCFEWGAVHSNESSLLVPGSLFTNNSTAYLGADIAYADFIFNQALAGGALLIMAHPEYSSIKNISGRTCYGNQVTNDDGGVVHARMDTKVYVHNSIFPQNSAQNFGDVLIDASSVLEINVTQVDRSNASDPSGALCTFNNSLFVATASSLEGNNGFLRKSLAVQNSTGYLDNCMFIRNQGIYAGAITFSFSELRLSHTVFLHNRAKSTRDISSDTTIDKFVNKTYTCRCVFKLDNITLKSKSTNFKKLTSKQGFLKQTSLDEQTNFVAEETQFVSSKL